MLYDMNLKKKQKLRNAILSHIIHTIRGEMQDWNNVEAWLPFDFADDSERDIAADMFETEAKRLFRRIV